jgi:hypothetical protein
MNRKGGFEGNPRRWNECCGVEIRGRDGGEVEYKNDVSVLETAGFATCPIEDLQACRRY